MRMMACLKRFGVRCRYAVQNELCTTPVQAARVVQGRTFFNHPASQRPHVRAIACDLYYVGRGNAQLTSQGDCRGQPVTRFAEGSRGLFPLRLSLELRAAAAGGRCRRHAISAAAPLAGRREAGPGMAFAARR